eukprot:c11380_g2_i1 orf=31-189(-)
MRFISFSLQNSTCFFDAFLIHRPSSTPSITFYTAGLPNLHFKAHMASLVCPL